MSCIYKNITVESDIDFINIKSLSIISLPNSHGVMTIKGTGYPNEKFQYIDNNISLSLITGRKIFVGKITTSDISFENDVVLITILAHTNSQDMDVKRVSRFFQDVGVTYVDIINSILTPYGFKTFYIAPSYYHKIGKPIIQYQETDWEFLVRLASMVNSSVYVLISRENNIFSFGLSEDNNEITTTTKEITSLDNRYFKINKQIGGVTKSHFVTKHITSYSFADLASRVSFGKNYRLGVFGINGFFDKDYLEFEYTVGSQELDKRIEQKPTNITGLVLKGTIIDTSGEKVKIHLDIDEKQDKATAYQFTWSAATSNLMYLMPKIGTQANLVIPSGDMKNAFVISGVRTNSSSEPSFGDFNNRVLSTEHGKNMRLSPEYISFDSSDNMLQIIDDQMLSFITPKEMKIVSKNSIFLKSKVIIMDTPQQIGILKSQNAALSYVEDNIDKGTQNG